MQISTQFNSSKGILFCLVNKTWLLVFESRPFCLSRNITSSKYSISGRATNLSSEKNKLFKFHNDGETGGKEVVERLCESHNALNPATSLENNSDLLRDCACFKQWWWLFQSHFSTIALMETFPVLISSIMCLYDSNESQLTLPGLSLFWRHFLPL